MKKQLRQITSNQIKAELFMALYQMETTGISLHQALDILKRETSEISVNISRMQSYIAKGYAVSDSGFKTKLFSTLDKESIHAGESSGHLAMVYKLLASHYADKARYQKQIKSKLHLPVIMLLLMIFIQPLPDLVLGAITGLDYLQLTLGTILQLILVIYIVLKGNDILRKVGLGKALDRLQLSLPILSSWILTRQINNFFTYLGLLLASGSSLSAALPIAIDTINNRVLRTKFKPIIQSIHQGNSLAESLTLIPEIKETIRQQVVIGEQSGRLDQSIQHLSSLQHEAIVAQNEFIADWIPRIIYGFIVVVIACSIITTGNISSIQ